MTEPAFMTRDATQEGALTSVRCVVTCICPPGLRIMEDGYHCKDIDECAEGLITCPDDLECKNTFGNFMCICKEGYQYQLFNGEYRCVDVGARAPPNLFSVTPMSTFPAGPSMTTYHNSFDYDANDKGGVL